MPVCQGRAQLPKAAYVRLLSQTIDASGGTRDFPARVVSLSGLTHLPIHHRLFALNAIVNACQSCLLHPGCYLQSCRDMAMYRRTQEGCALRFAET